MAYLDYGDRRPFQPVGMAAASVMSGTMLALILFAAPHFVPAVPEDPLELVRVQTKPVVNSTKQVRQSGGKQTTIVATRPTAVDDPWPIITTVDPGMLPADPIVPIDGGIEPLVRNPVLKGATVHPNFRSAFQPAYPPALVRLGIEGKATIRVLVGTDGRVKAVEAIRASEDAFLAATREQALRKWRFLPATRDGIAVESWREMTVQFQIRG